MVVVVALSRSQPAPFSFLEWDSQGGKSGVGDGAA